MLCPAVAPALTWLRAVTRELLGEAPPMDPLVLLADAPWRWPLVGDALWSALRVAYLGAVWEVRESRHEHPGPAAVVKAVVTTLRHSVIRDASRIDGVQLGGAGGPPIPQVWFRGPEPKLSHDEFEALWPASGGWYELQEGPTPAHVRLSDAWPVPFPVPAAVAGLMGVVPVADSGLQPINLEGVELEGASDASDNEA